MNKINNNNGNFKGKYTDKFSRVLQTLPVHRKFIASELGVPYSTLDNWIRGDAYFPPDMISDLFKITKDYRVINVVLPDDMIAVPVVKIRPHIKFVLKQLQIDTQREANDVLECMEKAQGPDSDGGKRITTKERRKCFKEIDEAIRELYRLKMALGGGAL